MIVKTNGLRRMVLADLMNVQNVRAQISTERHKTEVGQEPVALSVEEVDAGEVENEDMYSDSRKRRFEGNG